MFLILCGLGVSMSSGKQMRQNELDSTLSSAMEDAMMILKDSDLYTTEDTQQLVADAIQNGLVQTDSKSDYSVTVYTADKKKGILDVEVTEHYKQPFKVGKVTIRKTAVLEEYDFDDEEMEYVVTFSESEKVIGQFTINQDSKIPESQIPAGYKYKYKGKIYTAEELKNIVVKQDMYIQCIK